MLWDLIEQEFPKIKPDTIPKKEYDDLETRYNDLMQEISEYDK